jgi:hypothetical protein
MPANFAWMHAYLTDISSSSGLLEMWNLAQLANGSCESFANWLPLVPPLTESIHLKQDIKNLYEKKS